MKDFFCKVSIFVRLIILKRMGNSFNKNGLHGDFTFLKSSSSPHQLFYIFRIKWQFFLWIMWGISVGLKIKIIENLLPCVSDYLTIPLVAILCNTLDWSRTQTRGCELYCSLEVNFGHLMAPKARNRGGVKTLLRLWLKVFMKERFHWNLKTSRHLWPFFAAVQVCCSHEFIHISKDRDSFSSL